MMMVSVASSAVENVESIYVVTLHHNESYCIWVLPSPHLSPSEMHVDE